MYKELQMKFEDFVFPYGKLNAENEWVKLAELLPWDRIEERYAAKLENNGHPAHPVRMALGALLIKQRLRCSDEWTVRYVSENTQYLCVEDRCRCSTLSFCQLRSEKQEIQHALMRKLLQERWV